MQNNIDYSISRVLSGEASSEDILSLSDWLNTDERNRNEFRLLKSYWDAEVSFNHSLNLLLSIEKVKKQIHLQEKKRKWRRAWLLTTPLVATIALFIAISFNLLNTEKAANLQFYTYLTDNNKSTFTLNDGTRVTLNKNSHLTYSSTYGQGIRQVQLEGEAYFEVTKDATAPFEVEMNGASIQVLGTIFNVKADTENDLITATLLEGSIQFKSPRQQVILKPDQQLTFMRSTNLIAVQTVYSEKEIAWKDGLLKYKSVAFSTLMAELEKNYKVPIVINNRNLLSPSVTVSGTFSAEQPLEEVLQVINRSLPIKWTKTKDTYYIR